MQVMNVNELTLEQANLICDYLDAEMPLSNGRAVGIFAKEKGTAANDAQ